MWFLLSWEMPLGYFTTASTSIERKFQTETISSTLVADLPHPEITKTTDRKQNSNKEIANLAPAMNSILLNTETALPWPLGSASIQRKFRRILEKNWIETTSYTLFFNLKIQNSKKLYCSNERSKQNFSPLVSDSPTAKVILLHQQSQPKSVDSWFAD